MTILIAACVVALTASAITLPGDIPTPSGLPRNATYYIAMRDGTKIAVDVWLPQRLAPGARVPTVVRVTRYWRSQQIGFLRRIVYGLGLADPEETLPTGSRVMSDAGFVVLLVDARGSGASFGRRPIEWSPKERGDYRDLLDWVRGQHWSDGKLFAWGVSYDGNAADLMATLGVPGLIAVAPLYDDFDPVSFLGWPGGVRTDAFLSKWAHLVNALDANDVCAVDGLKGSACLFLRLYSNGVKPVSGGSVAPAVESHLTPDVDRAFKAIRFVDDRYSASGLTTAQLSPYAFRVAYAASRVPMQIWTGWLDAATVEGALARFNTLDTPQQLVIGAYSHGGSFDTDPFSPPDKRVVPEQIDQYHLIAKYFKARARGTTPPREILYYVQNGGGWHRTASWPPAGFARTTFYLRPGRRLSDTPPVAGSIPDRRGVDFSSTTGPSNRWSAQFGGTDVVYPDRRKEDTKLLTFTSAPFSLDVEITGAPILTLWASVNREDAALHAYLEDVAPDGRVTYLTEGLLRATDRRMSNNPPYWVAGPYHTHKRSDAQAVPQGHPMQLSFSLFSTSVIIRRGHAIRLAIAGADNGVFERVPARGTMTMSVFHEPGMASDLTLPTKPFDRASVERRPLAQLLGN